MTEVELLEEMRDLRLWQQEIAEKQAMLSERLRPYRREVAAAADDWRRKMNEDGFQIGGAQAAWRRDTIAYLDAMRAQVRPWMIQWSEAAAHAKAAEARMKTLDVALKVLRKPRRRAA